MDYHGLPINDQDNVYGIDMLRELCTQYELNILNMHSFIQEQTPENKEKLIKYKNGCILYLALLKNDINFAAYLLMNGAPIRELPYAELIHDMLYEKRSEIPTRYNADNKTLLQIAITDNDVYRTYFREHLLDKNPNHEFTNHRGLLFTPLECDVWKMRLTTDELTSLIDTIRQKHEWKKCEKKMIAHIVDYKFNELLFYTLSYAEYIPTDMLTGKRLQNRLKNEERNQMIREKIQEIFQLLNV